MIEPRRDLKTMLERLQGDLEDQARRGHGHITRKPCPGCGQAPTWPYRNAEHVCSFCRQLLSQAIEARLLVRETDEELVVVSLRDWETRYMEGEYESTGMNEDSTPRRRLEIAMHLLSLEISRPAPGENSHDHRYLYPQRERSLSPMNWRTVRRIRKVVAKILADLDLAIRDSLTECAQVAERKGQNVLLQLATGDMTVTKLNESNAKLAGKRARRR